MNKCPNCGQENNATATFCAFCGFKFTGAAAPATPPTPATPPLGSSPAGPTGGMPPQTPPPVTGAPRPVPGGPPPPTTDAAVQVQAPSIALMIFGGVNAAQGLFFTLYGVLIMADPSILGDQSADVDPMAAAVGVMIMSVFMIAASALSFFGGWKMRKLEGFGIAMAGAIAALVPCVTIYCCLPGIGLGIWALVVLNKPDVKSAFS